MDQSDVISSQYGPFGFLLIPQGWILMEAPLWCLKPRGEIPFSPSSGNQTAHIIYCQRTAGLYNAHPPFFYYILSWSNCKPARECWAIINSCSWKRTRSHNCTLYNVHPGHCSTSMAVHVLCSWKPQKWGSWLKSERKGAGSAGERSRKQFACYKVAEKLKATAFQLAAKWICNYFIYFNKIKLKPTELGLLISVRAQWGNKNGHSLRTHNY